MGMHFFSPANVMPLVENVRSDHTSYETIQAVTKYTKSIGKVGVLVKNCDGFVGNRMVAPYTTEAGFVLESGTSVPEIDKAISRFGMAIGPFTMGDIAGNDIGFSIRKENGFADPATRPKGMRYTTIADALVEELGRIGQKVGKGWYDYDANKGKGRIPIPSQEVADFVDAHRKKLGVKCETLSPDEIVLRTLLGLANEGFKILEEDICHHPDCIDVIYLYGYGWPAWRGGPMHWVDKEVGLKAALNKLTEYAQKYPGSDYFKPSKLLTECVERNIGIQEYYDLKSKSGTSKL